MGMKSLRDGAHRIDFKSPRALELINRFVKCTDYEFECSRIVGRKLESADNHAGYVRGGGCSKRIEVLTGREAGAA
jgi:hypothetical protein